jgi:hypothetical protein
MVYEGDFVVILVGVAACSGDGNTEERHCC